MSVNGYAEQSTDQKYTYMTELGFVCDIGIINLVDGARHTIGSKVRSAVLYGRVHYLYKALCKRLIIRFIAQLLKHELKMNCLEILLNKLNIK